MKPSKENVSAHGVGAADVLVVEGLSVVGEEAQASGGGAPKGLNLRIREAEFWVVEGSSGSGKSRLVEALAGFSKSMRGTVMLFGRNTEELQGDDWAEVRLRMGVLFEEGSRLFPQMTVLENVTLPLLYHREFGEEEAREHVGELLEALELTSVASRMAGRLGREWKPRVGLARALAMRPEFLLLDNPIANLDPGQTRWWVRFLSELSRGHAWYGGRPVTMMATSEDASRWVGSGARIVAIGGGLG